MESNEKEAKKAKPQNIIRILLLVLALIIVLHLTWTAAFKTKSFNAANQQRLIEHRNLVTQMTMEVLFHRLIEPVEQFSRLRLPQDNMEAAGIAFEFPEIIEICSFTSNDDFATIYTNAPSAKVHDAIGKHALDTYNQVEYIKTYWAPDQLLYWEIADIEGLEYTFTFLKIEEDRYRLVVTDHEKLKTELDSIFFRGETPYFAQYLYIPPKAPFAAKIEFFDQSDQKEEPFLTFIVNLSMGVLSGKGWEDIQDHEVGFYPWIISVQIFPESEKLLNSASAAGRLPLLPYVEFLIAVALTVLSISFIRKSKTS